MGWRSPMLKKVGSSDCCRTLGKGNLEPWYPILTRWRPCPCPTRIGFFTPAGCLQGNKLFFFNARLKQIDTLLQDQEACPLPDVMQSLGMGHALWLHGYMATWQANRLICFCILRTEGIDDDDSCRKLVAKVAWLEPFGGGITKLFFLSPRWCQIHFF